MPFPFLDPVAELESDFLQLVGGEDHVAWTLPFLNSASASRQSSMAFVRLSRAFLNRLSLRNRCRDFLRGYPVSSVFQVRSQYRRKDPFVDTYRLFSGNLEALDQAFELVDRLSDGKGENKLSLQGVEDDRGVLRDYKDVNPIGEEPEPGQKGIHVRKVLSLVLGCLSDLLETYSLISKPLASSSKIAFRSLSGPVR